MNKLTSIKQYRKEYVRALYGKLGKQSGLNPGVMWPRKEELKHLKQYEAAFSYNLECLIQENEAKKAEAARLRKQREEEVYNNMQKLPGAIKSFFDKIEEKKIARKKWEEDREKLIEEVREYLGYQAKPSDERFQAALAAKEEEELKAKKKEARAKRENASLDDLLAMAKDKK